MPRSPFKLSIAILFGSLALLTTRPVRSNDETVKSVQSRRPVALAIAGNLLFVANRDSGTVSVIDPDGGRVLHEQRVGRRLADLKRIPGKSAALLAIDETQHALIALSYQSGKLIEAARFQVAKYPVTLAVSEHSKLCSIASLWSRRLTLFSLGNGLRLRKLKTIDLPFAPRMQMFINRQWLLAADSFGGRLGLVNVSTLKLSAVRTIEGHNIRGLALSNDGRQLLIAHQLLNSGVPTTRSRVFWGTVMGNVLRMVSLSHLLPEHASEDDLETVRDEPIGRWSLIPLGEPERASGDPAAIAVTSGGKVAVALAGVGEVTLGRPELATMTRRKVGSRPTALALDQRRNALYIANTFSDSISVLDVEGGQVTGTIPLGSKPQLSLAQQGEVLFYDARLSLDGWYSCQSCHTDGHTNGLRNDNFADDTTGTPKQVPSLLGTSQTGPWSWKGSRQTLAEQISKSIESTMHGEGKAAAKENVAALEAYLKTLLPPPSLAAARDQLVRADLVRGRRVFEKQGCIDCHQGATLTSPETYDVGLTDEAGLSAFNPPSLRGVSQRDRLFHDGRARNLQHVITRFRHQLTSDLSKAEARDLLNYLRGI